MINVGIAGIGFMGMIHYLAYQKLRGVRVRAICEQDPQRLAGDWRTIKGNFGPPGRVMDLEGVSRYANLEDLYADGSLDLIDVCLPPALHAQVAVGASKAGHHVFCEKPIALTPGDAGRMVKAAQKAGKLLMIGHVLPFFPQYRFAYQTIVSGKYGKLIGGYFKRVISDPTVTGWLPHFFSPTVCGGPMIDLHIHDAHFIRLVFGMPKTVHTVGRMRGEVAELFTTQFTFDDPALFATATSGAIGPQGRPFTHAYEIYLERATLLFDSGMGKPDASIPATVLTGDGRVLRPKLGSGDPVDGFSGEIQEVLRSVCSNTPSSLLDGKLARDAVVLGHRQTLSLVKRREVRV